MKTLVEMLFRTLIVDLPSNNGPGYSLAICASLIVNINHTGPNDGIL
jgi:hypothetical protein